MRLKLLAPFRTDFHLNNEILILKPDMYSECWDSIESKKDSLIKRLKIDEGCLPPTLLFPHVSRQYKSISNRYQSLDHNALERQLHAVEIQIQNICTENRNRVFSLIKKSDQISKTLNVVEANHIMGVESAIRYLLDESDLQIVLRVFDFGTGLLDVDCDLDKWLNKIANQPSTIITKLQYLKEAGIVLGGALSVHYNQTILQELTKWLKKITLELGITILSQFNNKLSQKERDGEALWVTRTIVFDSAPKLNKQIKNAMIRFWLKDIIVGNDNDKHLKKILEREDAYHLKWVNYLFREQSYSVEGRMLDIKNGELTKPFCDQWEAMQYAQYFYAAMEIVDLNLTRILGICLSQKPEFTIDQLKELLKQNMNSANLLIIQYHDNKKYYKRAVSSTIADIAESWNFEEGLIQQVQNKLTLSRDRLEILINIESAKSASNREVILLVFSITAIFGTGIALAEYGRTMAADANLARSDINSSNLIDYFAGQPTDVILLFSFSISFFLLALYLLYRKRQSV